MAIRVIFEIGHPANYHYFKNVIKILENDGHYVSIVARDSEVIRSLLGSGGLKFYNRGRGSSSFLGKLNYMIFANFYMAYVFFKEKPDFFISFGSPYGLIARLFKRFVTIVFDDTEVGKYEQLVYKLYADVILTPESFYKSLGRKQLRFPGFMELGYLHPKYFKPDNTVLGLLDIKPDEKIIIFRTVAWNASHDFGQSGLSLNQLQELVKLCSTYGRVLVSSEKSLPSELASYELKIPHDKLHDLLYFAHLYIGEGATTASECVMLGTPAVYINSINAGTLMAQAEAGLLFNFRDYEGVYSTVQDIMQNYDSMDFSGKHELFISGKIDISKFISWFIETYPESMENVKTKSLSFDWFV